MKFASSIDVGNVSAKIFVSAEQGVNYVMQQLLVDDAMLYRIGVRMVYRIFCTKLRRLKRISEASMLKWRFMVEVEFLYRTFCRIFFCEPVCDCTVLGLG